MMPGRPQWSETILYRCQETWERLHALPHAWWRETMRVHSVTNCVTVLYTPDWSRVEIRIPFETAYACKTFKEFLVLFETEVAIAAIRG